MDGFTLIPDAFIEENNLSPREVIALSFLLRKQQGYCFKFQQKELGKALRIDEPQTSRLLKKLHTEEFVILHGRGVIDISPTIGLLNGNTTKLALLTKKSCENDKSPSPISIINQQLPADFDSNHLTSVNDFLHLLYPFGEAPENPEKPLVLNIWAYHKEAKKKESYWYGMDELPQVADKTRELVKSGYDVYFGLGLAHEKGKKHERVKADDVVAIPGFWLDIDKEDKSNNQLRLSADEVVAKLQNCFPLEPTLIVNSGNGYHVYWLFKELWQFDDDAERAQAQKIAKRFEKVIRDRWQGGWVPCRQNKRPSARIAPSWGCQF